MDSILSVLRNLIDLSGMARLDFVSVLFSLFLAIAVSFIISQIYKYTHRGLNYELAFMSTLVLLAPIIAVVMLFIRGDLVLSLGLIGSISIIRFRTPIKDTRDMVFIFWTIAVGLGCGTYNWNVVIISTIFIGATIFLLHFLRYGHSRGTDYVLVVTGQMPMKGEEISGILGKYAKERRVRSHEANEDYWETIFEVQLIDLTGEVVTQLIREIKALEGIKGITACTTDCLARIKIGPGKQNEKTIG